MKLGPPWPNQPKDKKVPMNHNKPVKKTGTKPIRRLPNGKSVRNSKIRASDIPEIAKALGVEIDDVITTGRRIEKESADRERYDEAVARPARGTARGSYNERK